MKHGWLVVVMLMNGTYVKSYAFFSSAWADVYSDHEQKKYLESMKALEVRFYEIRNAFSKILLDDHDTAKFVRLCDELLELERCVQQYQERDDYKHRVDNLLGQITNFKKELGHMSQRISDVEYVRKANNDFDKRDRQRRQDIVDRLEKLRADYHKVDLSEEVGLTSDEAREILEGL